MDNLLTTHHFKNKKTLISSEGTTFFLILDYLNNVVIRRINFFSYFQIKLYNLKWQEKGKKKFQRDILFDLRFCLCVCMCAWNKRSRIRVTKEEYKTSSFHF